MELHGKLDHLFDFFDKVDSRFDLFFENPEGAFVFSNLHDLNSVFEQLTNENLISPKHSLLETGSGDGRVLALASYYGLQAYGIELSKQVCKESKESLNELYCCGTIPSEPMVTCGDFRREQTYIQLGKRFSSFDLIFNYNTLTKEITRLLTDQGRVGCLFLHLSLQPNPLVVDGLVFVKEIPVTTANHYFRVYEVRGFND